MKNNVTNLNYFLEVIDQGVCPENMNVDLNPYSHRLSFFHNKNHGHLKDKHVDQLCNALITGRCAKSPNIDLSWNSLKDNNIKKIANVLYHPNRPEKISLNLTGNSISDKGAIGLLDAIQFGQASGTEINLSGDYKLNMLHMQLLGNKITDKTALHLAYLLKSKNLPHDMSLDFSNTKISNYGVEAIVKALAFAIRLGRDLKGLSLKFNFNGIEKNLLTRLDNLLKHQVVAGNKFIGVASNRASFYQPVNANAVLKEIEKVESTSSLTL